MTTNAGAAWLRIGLKFAGVIQGACVERLGALQIDKNFLDGNISVSFLT